MSPRVLLVLSLSFFSFSIAHPLWTRGSDVSSEQIISIAPASSTCAGAPQPEECRTADQVASVISTVFSMYGITSPGEKAALTATMAFESDDFKYNLNYVPGNPGQGTRNMQSAEFNILYAQSIPALASSLQAVADSPNGIRDLLTANDIYDFGSAAWFLTAHCGEATRAALQSEGLVGWRSYVSDCIFTPPTGDRQAYWERAAQAFGVP